MIGKHWKVASLLMLLLAAEVLAKKKKGKKNKGKKNKGKNSTQVNCAHDCCIVVNLWKHFGKSTSVDPNSPTACCSMDRVQCSGTSVTNLNWFYKGLSGTIPSWIGNLSNLRGLRLGFNQLTGTIPSTIGNLSNLKNLLLGFNQLSGPIPSTIGNLSNLERLSLSRNQLSGPIPSTIGNLSNLELVYLGKNPNLSGTLRTRAGNISTGGTQIIVCGSAASNAPGSFYRNEHPACLSVSSSTLRKRNTIPSYHHEHGGKKYTFTCTINGGSNPYQDCINHMAFACYTLGSSACKDVVDARFAKFNRHWKGMLKSCARWKTRNTSGCEASLADLRENAWYHLPKLGQVRPDIIFTNELRDQLWSKVE